MSGEATRQTAVLRAVAAKGCLTVKEIADETGLARNDAATAAGKLLSRGLIERVERGCYRATADGEAQAASGKPLTSGPRTYHRGANRHPGSLRQRVWTALRNRMRGGSPGASIGDLTQLAARDEKQPAGEVQKFLLRLYQAGYLRRLPPIKDGQRRYLRYELVRDTGPRSPQVRQGGRTVHDPNTGEDFPCVR